MPALRVFLLCSALTLVAASPRSRGVLLEDGSAVELRSGREILLEVVPRPGEVWDGLALRLCDPSLTGKDLRERSGQHSAARPGSPAAIPFGLLSEEWKARCLRALFPEDGIEGGDWVHRPGASAVETYGEGVWQVAEWFTGDGGNFRAIARDGGDLDPLLQAREVLRVPAALLRSGLRSSVPRKGAAAREKAATPSLASGQGGGGTGEELEEDEEAEEGASAGNGPEVSERTPSGVGAPSAKGARASTVEPPGGASGAALAAGGDLTYGEDSQGRYALYRLKTGEALYSAVAVRFTGRVDPEEVNQAAEDIARASGISDVTSIPVGHPVRIPLDLLLPEFLPPGDPRREDYETSAREASRYRNSAHASNLAGVHVILDAGHGGVDRGAIGNGVQEHEYVYDVLCRLKRRLEAGTEARVHVTVMNPEVGYQPRDARVLPVSSALEVLTDPPHANTDSSQTQLGVNLRWYLANALYRRLTASGVPPGRIVFISLHADSLHPSLRGGMVYIPGERYRRGTFGVVTLAASRYREVRESPRVSFTRAEGSRSEGLSRELAGRMLQAMKGRGLAVHAYMPVRDSIIRRKRAWVPAVLRANLVPVKVLLEIANLNNAQDARLMREPAFREKTARAVVDALLLYYSP